jgi:hypothetical protein
MNRHLMGFFPPPIMVPPKRNPEEAPSPRRDLFSFVKEGGEVARRVGREGLRPQAPW